MLIWLKYTASYVTIVEVGNFTIEASFGKCSSSDNSSLYVDNGEVKTFNLSGCRGWILKLKKGQPTGLSLCRVKVYGTCTGINICLYYLYIHCKYNDSCACIIYICKYMVVLFVKFINLKYICRG